MKIHENLMQIWCRFDADLMQIWRRFDADLMQISNLHQMCITMTQIVRRLDADLKSASNLHQICTKSASNLHQICIKSAPNLHQICIKSAPNLHQICINFSSNLHQFGIKKKKMFPRHVKMMCLETSSAETSSSPCLQILRSTCGFLKCTNSTCTSSTCTSPEARQASWVPLTTHMYMQVSSTYLSSQSTQAQIKLHVYTIDNSQVHPSLKYMPV